MLHIGTQSVTGNSRSKTAFTIHLRQIMLNLITNLNVENMKKHDPMNLRIFRKVMVGLSAVTCLVSPSYASGDANSSFFTEKTKNTPAVYEVGQTREKLIQGFVRDKKGEAVIGVNIQVKDKGTGVITNMDGLYQMKVPENAVLIVSCIGYKTQEVVVGKSSTVNVTLEEDARQLDEVVVTAFGISQKKETLVGSVDQVKPDALKAPTTSLSSNFAGKLAGVIAVQRSGEPGADGANFWIRGKSTFSSAAGANSPLIVLDGVEISSGDLDALDPEVIEGFSILKDATATALYGTRGANGVMIVTTKQGADLAKPIINFRFETAINVMNEIPEMVDGVSYMKLYNEARRTRREEGKVYSEEKIAGTIAGKNPYLYPNVNWFDEMFNKMSDSERFNFNIRGGKKAVHYFMSASIKRDGGNLKSRSKEFFSFNNNINVIRYDFVNNLSIKMTPTTKVALGLNVSMKDWKGPAKSADEIFSLSRQASPVDFPVYYPSEWEKLSYTLWGGMEGGTFNNGYRNPVAEYATGYKTTFSSTVDAKFRIDQDLKMILPGLKWYGLVSFKNYSSTVVTRTAGYNQFQIASDNGDGTYTLGRVNEEEKAATLGTKGSSSGDRWMYVQTHLDYNRKFGDHKVNVMLLYDQKQTNVNNPDGLLASLPKRKQGVAGRLSYGYDDRYLIEANFGCTGSENFAAKHRWGFFPSVAVGYNISQEKFWKPMSDIISHLKFRASYGLVGNDGVGSRFAYLEDIVLGSWGYTTGTAMNTTYKGPAWNRYYNPDLTWEIGKKLNVGMDIQLFHDFNLHVDGFKEIRSNIFMQRSNTLPKFAGTGGTAIYGNMGKMKNVGFDMSMNYHKRINKNFFISARGTFTFAKNTILERDEPPYQLYPQLSSVGHSVDSYLIYDAIGLFKDDAEIAGSPEQTLGYIPMPGDIRYRNIANAEGKTDGIIDKNDRIWAGYPKTPEIVYGFGSSMKYKKWDFSFFFQGVAHTSLLIENFHPFVTKDKTTIPGVMKFITDDYWSEDNPNPNAAYPRLTNGVNENNQAGSTFWLRNGAFLKLKNAEIGFTHKCFRAYISGRNLLTFSPFKLWDPEMGGGNGMSYPTQRTYNIGIQFTFK